MFEWLEYSKIKDAAFCYVCRHFASKASKTYDNSFTNSGMRNWKKAIEKMRKHTFSEIHKGALISILNYKTSTSNIICKLNSQFEKQIQENRKYLKAIYDVILLCARQELALRGHDQSESSLYKGNFLEILKLYAENNDILKKYLKMVI